MTISKSKIKFIHSLATKKNRQKEQLFIAEGPKCVEELLKEGFHATDVCHTPDYSIKAKHSGNYTTTIVTDDELRKISQLQHPQQVLSIFSIPNNSNPLEGLDYNDNLYLCLDGVQDPGNLGTIIRTADWFGIQHIFCSYDTVDAYNPKVVQSTMGSIARVKIHYLDIAELLNEARTKTPIYGMVLDGENIYHQHLENNGIIVMGNEGNGISDEIKTLLTHKLLIPPFKDRQTESLNVAIATAITCAEFRRNVK